MKKLFGTLLLIISIYLMTGCVETVSTDEKGNSKKEFTINEIATVNTSKIKINSVKKINKECFWEYNGKCQSYTNPENDFFLIIDLTIENTGNKETNISSLMSFDIKDTNGEKGKYTFLTKSIKSQLDGGIMAGDLLKGQIAYDVKNSEKYYFYYRDSLLDTNIKFVINKNDIQ